MASDEPRDGKCGKEIDGGYCELDPVKDDDGDPVDGYCHIHDENGAQSPNSEGKGGAPKGNTNGVGGGAPKGHVSGGAKEGNQNAMKHGAQSDPELLYEHLDDRAQQWIDEMHALFLKEAPFDDDSALSRRLHTTCTMMWQERSGRRQINKDGLEIEKTQGVGEYGAIKEPDAHHLNSVVSTLSSSIRQRLKAYGCLPDPDSQKANELATLTQAVKDQSGD